MDNTRFLNHLYDLELFMYLLHRSMSLYERRCWLHISLAVIRTTRSSASLHALHRLQGQDNDAGTQKLKLQLPSPTAPYCRAIAMYLPRTRNSNVAIDRSRELRVYLSSYGGVRKWCHGNIPKDLVVHSVMDTETIGSHLQVDRGGNDSDSTLGEDRYTITTSLASSVKEFRHENGRRYHSFQEDAYFLPNDVSPPANQVKD
nr:hypothetical protein CFP56_01278 [Quercus suber]